LACSLDTPCDWRATNNTNGQWTPERYGVDAGTTKRPGTPETAVLPGRQEDKISRGQNVGGGEEPQDTTVFLPLKRGESDVIGQDGNGEVTLTEELQVATVVLSGNKGGALARPLEALMGATDMLVMPVSFELLKQEDIWICDTGASTHSTYNKGGATNERQTGSASLGHAGTAVKAESTIDIPGRFVTRDGSYGIKATLQGVSYNRQHNFNLLSLTRLLYKQGWVIEEGNKHGITIMKNGQERIKFDIVVPTPNGALYACRFLRNSEVSSV